MLRVYFLQHEFKLSGPGDEDALNASSVLRSFAGIDLDLTAMPDETITLDFRHFLENINRMARFSTRPTCIWRAKAFVFLLVRLSMRRSYPQPFNQERKEEQPVLFWCQEAYRRRE